MHQYLKFIVPGYVLIYAIVLLALPALVVGKKIGKSPVVLSATDDAHGLIAQYFKLCMIMVGVYALCILFIPDWERYFLPIIYLENDLLALSGLIILALSLLWTSASQIAMSTSWRVGIDQQQKTALVTSGIFRYSRNPIYLGMIASFIGLLLITPNAFTLIIVLIGNILIQIQVRLEEDFLYRSHGQDYLAYKSTTRRFI